MEDIIIKTIEKLELDPHKSYILKIGEKGMHRAEWTAFAKSVMVNLERIHIHNVVLTPPETELEVIETMIQSSDSDIVW